MIKQKYIELLVCPVCKADVEFSNDRIICKGPSCNNEYPIIDNIPVFLSSYTYEKSDLVHTMDKWTKIYRGKDKDYREDPTIKVRTEYIKKFCAGKKGFFLDAGCGDGMSSVSLSQITDNVVGIDISLNAAIKANNLFSSEGMDGFFLCCDMRNLPFRDDVFDFIFADGSIEHFKDTETALNELKRTLNNEGGILATVPVISLSTLTYQQLHGDIPDLPGIKQLWEFFHFTLFNGRFMEMGYEKSFTMSKIRDIFKSQKFEFVETGHFDTYNEIKFTKNKALKKILRRLAKHRLFWPLIYVYGKNN